MANEHIIINNDRSITIPASSKTIGVQYDHNVETLTFDCPRYWNSLDMSAMRVYINYVLPDGTLGAYLADDVTIDEQDDTIMHFSWTITRNVTRHNGTVTFLVCIKNVDSEGNETNHWNSALIKKQLMVSEGLECTEPIQDNPDFISLILLKVDAASRSEINAKTSEENAKTSEENAKTSEENAKTSEENAKTYADGIPKAANAKIEEIQNKGDEVLNSIPEDYTGLSQDVDELKNDLAILLEGGEVPINISESEVSGFTGNISYPEKNAFVVTGNNRNAKLIFKIPTDIGEAYTASLYTHTPITAYICKNEGGASGNAISPIIVMDSAGKCVLPFTAVGANSYLNVLFTYNYSEISVYDICLSIPKKFMVDAIPDNSISISKLNSDNFNLGTLPHYFEITDAPIHFVNGLETEIYTDGLFETDVDINGIFSESNYGNIFSGRFLGNRFTPNTSIGTGTHTAVLESRNKHGNRWSSTLKIKASAMPANPENKKYILFIGDSLIARGTFPFYFQEKLSELGLTNYELIGRVKCWVGSEYVRFEATGGYAWNNYVDDPATLPSSYDKNWFWHNGKLDMDAYVQTYCDGHAPDYIICNVGWNHYVNTAYSPDTMDEKCRMFIAFVHESLPNCKIILNGMHKGYPENAKHEYREYALNTRRIYLKIASEYDYVEYCDVASYFDGRYGMNLEQRNANIYTEDQETYVRDNVHPNELGMKMHAMADMCCFLWMAAQES